MKPSRPKSVLLEAAFNLDGDPVPHLRVEALVEDPDGAAFLRGVLDDGQSGSGRASWQQIAASREQQSLPWTLPAAATPAAFVPASEALGTATQCGVPAEMALTI